MRPSFTTVEVTVQARSDLDALRDLESTLDAEYTSGNLTSAQRVQVLSERRKIIQLRSLITGVISPQNESEEH